MLKIVLDTNVLLVSLAPQSEFSPIFEALLNGKFQMLVSNEMLSEYEEVTSKRYDRDTVSELFMMLVNLPNIALITPYFHWKLITADPDDDKFVDCAVAGNADFIVTNDRHFNILPEVPFPTFEVKNAEEFLNLLKDL